MYVRELYGWNMGKLEGLSEGVCALGSCWIQEKLCCIMEGIIEWGVFHNIMLALYRELDVTTHC